MPAEPLPIPASERRERLLADLAAEGASRCCYAPGADDPEAWPTSTCDCKYVHFGSGSSEQTGCCEMRAAYGLLYTKHPGRQP